MALNATTLENLIDTKLATLDPSGYGANPQRDAVKENLIRAVAQAVVEHIQAAAVVQVTGVTAGAASASGTIS